MSLNSDQTAGQIEPTSGPEEIQVQSNAEQTFPIVGIGASAGGVEAFLQLVGALATDTGMAFVLILHLDPDRPSLLSEILARATQMSVREAQDGMVVEPNCVYVIPPNRRMLISNRALKLSPRENTKGKHMPVDAFFYSLAEDLGSKAIGVVLTGGDGDGSQGVGAIKEKGGITFAQDEQSSQVSSMPRSAVATGQVDFVLPPQAIAEALGRLGRSLHIGDPAQPVLEETASDEKALQAVFALLRHLSGADFGQYKQSMIQRRLQRRMVLHRFEYLEEYARYLKEHPEEVKALYQEALINVTDFFRDPEIFLALSSTVFSRLVVDRSPSEPIRIWVPGCSSGQEAYSLAICLLEFLAEQAIQIPIQLFATDLSEVMIEEARAGIYRKDQLKAVSAQRLERFFVPVKDSYQVGQSVREMCVFARHNLGSDPPFSRIDLISCRNVLIYFAAALQKRALTTFHFALKPLGFLLLGNSESLGDASGFFTPVDRKYKLYTRRSVPTSPPLNFIAGSVGEVPGGAEPRRQGTWNELEIKKEADRLAFERYVPPGVIVDSKQDILELRGRTGPYLEMDPGRPSTNVMKMLHSSLRMEVHTAILLANKQNAPVSKEGIQLQENNRLRQIRLEVIPFQPASGERYFLVQFVEAHAPQARPAALKRWGPRPGGRVDREQLDKLQQELATTREFLQATSEEQEAINQDLRVANEEVLSSNEELQSTNEELQTAKEELQAANEELMTSNDERQRRNLELAWTSNDLENLLLSTQLPILLLDEEQRIRRFTEPAGTLLHLIEGDVGRPLRDINLPLNVPDLPEQIRAVIATLVTRVQEVQDGEGHWYEMRLRPCRTLDNKIQGAVLLLQDIDALKRSAEALKAAHARTDAIVETARDSLLVLDADLRVVSANRAFYETFQVLPDQTVGCRIFELADAQWDIPELRTLLDEILTQNAQIQDFELNHAFEPLGEKTLLLNASRLAATQMILLAVSDITEKKRSEAERTASEMSRIQAQEANRVKDEFLAILSHELRTPLNPIIGWTQILRRGSLAPDKQERALEIIERNAKLQNQLIGDLLDISRIEQGKLQCEMQPVEFQAIVHVAVEAVLQSAEKAGVQLVVDAHPAPVMADPTRLQQVVWNLLVNAVKFTPALGQVEVHLEADEAWARLRVQDTGKGIPAEVLPHIFERFQQSDSSTTRSQGGLGLGLFIVRHIVELHGGRVRAESEGEDRGATFTVELPLSAAR